MATTAARAGAIGGLVFLGVTAVVGAVPMLRDPTGAPWSIPLTMLRYSPFHSFLIPGIVLLLSNGLLSFVVLWFVLSKRKNYEWWVMGQGVVLAGWLLVEIVALRLVAWPHWFYGAVAALLVSAGWALRRKTIPLQL